MQARKSMPAEPAVACCGNGNSRPMRGSKIRSLTVRCIRLLNSTRTTAAHPLAGQSRGSSALSRAAARTAVRRWQALRNERDEFARHVDFRSARHLHFAARPDHDERVVLAIERDSIADFVRGDHVELLALELDARILLDV